MIQLPPARLVLAGQWLAQTLIAICLLAPPASAGEADRGIDYAHGYAFLSTPARPADFEYFDYANPDAPKGGRIRLPQMGNWDNFNSVAERGRLAAGMSFWGRDENLLYDSLMVPALDEPATYYGSLAEGIAVADDWSWIAFRLREGAYWHDGEPITVDDVLFSFNAYKTHGGPSIRSAFGYYDIERINDREFRFLIPPPFRGDPNLPLRLAGMLVMPKHYWEADGNDISRTTVKPPLGSGPYRVADYSIGRWVEYERVDDYWGRDLPINRGKYNFDRVKYDYFRDDQIQTEAVKGNVVDLHVENVSTTWYSSYNIPAVEQGHLKKIELQLDRPAGLWWPIFWNLEQPRFQDIRVRKALWLLNDFDWFNKRAYGYWGHATSFFHASELASSGLPGELELELLRPLREQIPETVFTTPYSPQPNTGAGWSRDNLLEARRLFMEAGWEIRDGKMTHTETGEHFHIRFVAVSPALAATFIPISRLLERLGITSSIKAPEISNWLYRMRSGDFDAGAIAWSPTYTPSLAIKNAFLSTEADKDYSSNWSNLQDPAIDALIAAILNAPTWDEYVAAIRAFDRVMLHNYYWISMMSKTRHAIAYWDRFGRPENLRLSRLAHTDLWWFDADKDREVRIFTGDD